MVEEKIDDQNENESRCYWFGSWSSWQWNEYWSQRLTSNRQGYLPTVYLFSEVCRQISIYNIFSDKRSLTLYVKQRIINNNRRIIADAHILNVGWLISRFAMHTFENTESLNNKRQVESRSITHYTKWNK